MKQEEVMLSEIRSTGQNNQKLMNEFDKYLHDLCALITKEVFTKRSLNYNFRNCRVTLLPNHLTTSFALMT